MSNIAFALVALIATSDVPPGACEVVQKPADHWGEFQSKVTIGIYKVGVRKGISQCTFSRVDAGECFLIDPGAFAVEINGEEQWLSVPAGTSARLTFEGGAVTCRSRNLIRTD